MGLRGRVKRLEREARVAPCEECGFDGDLTKMELEVIWNDLDSDTEDPQDGEPMEPEFCGTCGHQLVYVVRWLDIPDSPEKA